MLATRFTLGLLVAAALAATGCGGGKDDGGDTTKKDDASAATLKRVSAALAKATSIHIEGTQTDADGEAKINGDIKPDALRLRIRQPDGESIILLSVSHQTYLKANSAYWTRNASAQVASVLAGKWVKAPASQSGDLQDEVDRLLPAALAHCVASGTGTLTSRTGRLGADRVTILEDAGDKPGTEPGELYVAATGEPLPLRVTQTGPRAAGGKLDRRCDDPKSTQRAQDLTFAYGREVTLEAPADAIDLDKLHSGADDGGSGQAA